MRSDRRAQAKTKQKTKGENQNQMEQRGYRRREGKGAEKKQPVWKQRQDRGKEVE